MKPRSQRLRDDARLFGTFSLVFLFGAIFCGSVGYCIEDTFSPAAGFALYLATMVLVIASVAMLCDMFKARREAESEEYWETKRFYDKFDPKTRL